MVFPQHIIKLIEKHCGRKIASSADCEFVILDIESVTGERIGLNTIKRLLGFNADERKPRMTTLDIIARYLGCNSWDELIEYENTAITSAFLPGKRKEIMVRDLATGRVVRISYRPNRVVRLRYDGNHHFTVIESRNSKLQAGDLLTITHIIHNYPLLVSEVIRDGKSLGSFTAGAPYGITFSLQ